LRQLNLKTLKPEIRDVTGQVPVEVAGYLLNRKRHELSEIEEKRKVSITIEGDQTMVSGENRIVIIPQKPNEDLS
jgi:ribonuclease E